MSRLKLKYGWAPVCWFLLESLAGHEFTAGEYRILHIVIRETYGRKDKERPGYQREKSQISYGDFVKRTGLSKKTVIRALSSLIEKNVLVLYSEFSGTTSKCYGINTKIDSWKARKIGEIWEREYPRHASLEWSPTTTLEENSRVVTHDHQEWSPTTTLEWSPTTTIPEYKNSPSGPPNGGSSDSDFSPIEKIERKIERSPLTPQGERGGNCLRHERAAQAIFGAIEAEYFSAGGAPRSKLRHCRQFVSRYLHALDDLKLAINSALKSQRAIEERTGQLTRKPWRILDEAAALMKRKGIQPRDPTERRKTA